MKKLLVGKETLLRKNLFLENKSIEFLTKRGYSEE